MQNSDWVYTPDCNLQDSIIRLWTQWRHQVRQVDIFERTDEATEYLNKLQNNMPPVIFNDGNYKTLESYKEGLIKMINRLIHDTTNSIYEDMVTREILLERFDEAIRYVGGNTEHNFLIEIEAEHTGKSHEEVAQSFVEDRKNYLLKIIAIEKTKNLYLKRVETVENIQQCDMIRDDLQILGSKKVDIDIDVPSKFDAMKTFAGQVIRASRVEKW